MDCIISKFSVEFIVSQCVIEPVIEPESSTYSDSESDDPSFGSGLVSPSDSISSSITTMSINTNDPTYSSESGPASTELESSLDPNRDTSKQNASEVVAEEDFAGSSSVSSVHKSLVEKNLLMQIWYFAAQATHLPHRKLGKLARRVIIKISKILRSDPASLEVAHDVVSCCYRTQAEGLLDRVLQARESPCDSMSSHSGEGGTAAGRLRGSGKKRDNTPPNKRQEQQVSQGKQPHASTKGGTSSVLSLRGSPAPIATSSLKTLAEERTIEANRDLNDKEEKSRGKLGNDSRKSDDVMSLESRNKERRKLNRQRSHGNTDEFVASDESFQSAVSELDLDCSGNTLLAPEGEGEGEEEEGEVGGVSSMLGVADEESSSACSSHDSRKSTASHKNSSNSSIEKGVVLGFPTKPGYME